MNAQLLLTPSLFEMSDLAKERFGNRTNETASDTWVNWVKEATPDNLIRREMGVEVDPLVCHRKRLETYASEFCWAMHRLEEKGDRQPIAPNLTAWFHSYIEQRCPPPEVLDADDKYYVEMLEKLPKWWFSNRTERGAAAAKAIIRSVNKLYPEKSENISRRNTLLGIINNWAELAAVCRSGDKKKYLVVASREPNSFMSMGHMSCDTGSCYYDGGEWHWSPLNLALAKNCYVFYVKEKDGNSEYQVVGRAWGYLDADDMAFTNVYGRNFTGGKEAIGEILCVAAQKWTGKKILTGNNIDCWTSPDGQYDNGDIHSTKSTVDFDSVGYEYYGSGDERISCGDCGGMCHEEDAHWCEDNESYVCECCLDNCCYVDGDLYHEDSCTEDDFSGETILSCNAVETYCGQTCHEECATYIDLGEHAGSYAHDGDENLSYDTDGEYYIKGTWTTEEELNESEADDD